MAVQTFKSWLCDKEDVRRSLFFHKFWGPREDVEENDVYLKFEEECSSLSATLAFPTAPQLPPLFRLTLCIMKLIGGVGLGLMHPVLVQLSASRRPKRKTTWCLN